MADETTWVGEQRGLLKPTLQITVFSTLGIFISFATQIIVAAKFGATMQRDAYFAAAVVPSYITAVLLGSLTVTFVPIFIEYEAKKNKEEAWKVASILTNLIFLFLFGTSLLGFIFARQLISVTAPGFKREELSLTATLLRIIFPSIVFSGLSNLLTSIYYAHHRFLRPAAVPVIKAVLILLSVIVLTRYWGIKSLAFGNLVGAIVGFFILAPILLKQGRYRFSWDLHNEGVIQIIKVMSPLVFAGVFYRATTVIERMIASTLPTGSISYLGYAGRITQILVTIATAGISTTIFPVMARSWAEDDLAKVREYFAKGVCIIMLITFPIAALFVVLRLPIVQVVLERGAFTHDTTLAVADVLMIFMLYFVCIGLGNVVGKGFYISKKTKLLAILGIIETTIYCGYSYVLAKHFSYIGLATATSLYYLFPIIINTFIMRTIYNGIEISKIFNGFIKILIATVSSGYLIYLGFMFLSQKQSLIMSAGTSAILGLIVYVILVLYVLRVEEATEMKNSVCRKMIGFGLKEVRKGRLV